MGWFGLIITDLLLLAVAITIVYLIFNLIYKIGDSTKVNSVISCIVTLIMFIVFLTSKDGPKVDGGEFEAGSTGLIAATSIVLAFPISNLMVASHDGDDVLSGIGQSIFCLGGFMLISIIILCFSETYWPLTVLSGLGILTSVITFFKS